MVILEKNVQQAEKDIAIAIGRFAPRVNLNVSYNQYTYDYAKSGTSYFGSYSLDDRNDFWEIGINLQMPLFEGGSRFYAVQKLKQERERLRHRLAQVRQDIQNGVNAAFMNLQEARERIHLAESSLSLAKENYERYKARYRLHVSTLADLLSAQARLTSSEVNLNQSLLDYQLALARLFYSIGEIGKR
jgi:outer membrane protein TolC